MIPRLRSSFLRSFRFKSCLNPFKCRQLHVSSQVMNQVAPIVAQPMNTAEDFMWRKKYVGLHSWTEDLNKYESGAYFAVHLGDVFGDGRYKIIHKLGNGGFSQVWLAKDQCPGGHGYVSLKIVGAGTSELRILQHLNHAAQDHPGRRHVVKLLDHFAITRSNREYHGLVLETTSMNTFRVTEAVGRFGKYSPDLGKRTARQTALGLAFLHECRVGHGDLHTGNVCFAMPGIAQLDDADIMSILGPPFTTVVKRKDGKAPPPSMPRYTVRNCSFPQTEGDVKIVDLGQAFFFDTLPEQIQTPGMLRAPELLFLRNPPDWDHRIDIWALGCLIYELFIGQTPLESPGRETLIWEMICLIGPLPSRWKSQFDPRNFLNPEGTRNEDYDFQVFEVHLRRHYDWLGGIMTDTDLENLTRLMREMLVLEPGHRKTAMEISEHQWLKETL